MSKAKVGTNNPMFGKSHTEQTKLLMNKAKVGRSLDNVIKEAISIANGTPVYLYVACSSTDAFALLKQFSSLRKLVQQENI